MTNGIGGFAVRPMMVQVNNVALTLSNDSITPDVNEGGFGTLSGSVADPGFGRRFGSKALDWIPS